MIYAVEIEQVRRKTVYVKADSPEDAAERGMKNKPDIRGVKNNRRWAWQPKRVIEVKEAGE